MNLNSCGGKGQAGIQKSSLHTELERRVYAPTRRWVEGCVGKRGRRMRGRETPKTLSVLERVEEDQKKKVKED